MTNAEKIARQEAAVARVRARGISSLYPREWEAAIREELGITAEEQEAQEQAARAAADARLAKGQADLHARAVSAQSGKLL